MNPAIRAAVAYLVRHGIKVIGIHDGWRGLLTEEVTPLGVESVAGIIGQGGTILGTSRTNPLKVEGDLAKVIKSIKAQGLDAIIAIGGDDTLSVAAGLWERGVPVVGVPKTMDNDIEETDYCFGFDTAVTVAVEAVERLRDTARSHRRIMVLEVMGRYTGWVALWTGMASGADWILIPEVPLDLEEMCENLHRIWDKRRYALVVTSEGLDMGKTGGAGAERDAFGHEALQKRGVGQWVADQIHDRTGVETRASVIGHIQRGGAPTTFDRILATRLGIGAAELIRQGRFGLMAALKGNDIVPVDLRRAVTGPKKVPESMYRMAKLFFAG